MGPGNLARWIALAIGLATVTTGCRGKFDEQPAPDAMPMFNFDAAPADAAPPVMSVTDNGSNIVITVPGRYEVQFVESGFWQPLRWTDASRDTDLSGTEAPVELDAILTPLILCFGGGCVGAPQMTDIETTITEQSDSAVDLVQTWDWLLNGQAVSGRVEYSFDIHGTWTGAASATNKDVAAISGTLEFADIHVNTSLPWRVTDAFNGDFTSFSLAESQAGGAVAFEVSVTDDMSTSIANDETYNRYFRRPLNLAPSSTVDARWSTQLWRAP